MTIPLQAILHDIELALNGGEMSHAVADASDYISAFILDRCDKDPFGETVPSDHWDAALNDLEVELTALMSTDDDRIEPVNKQVTGLINRLKHEQAGILDQIDADFFNKNRPIS